MSDPADFTSRVGRWAVRNVAIVGTAVVVLAAGGLVSMGTLPSGIYPEVEFPRIVVLAHGGDAPPDVFQTNVARPLEQALITVIGVKRVRSRTIRGSSDIQMQFVPGTDMWRALQLVESSVNAVKNDLPPDVSVEVQRVTPTIAVPVITFNVTGHADPRDLRDLADYVVRPALARVPGVGQVGVLGGLEREIEVVVDPARAAALHLGPHEIAQRLRDEIVLGAVGRFDQDRQLVTVVASSEATSLDDIAAIPIAATPEGGTVPLSAVATVREGAADPTVAVGGPGGETVVVAVNRLDDASTPEVVRDVRRVARDLAKSFPAGVRIDPVYDQAELVDESIASVRDAILIGILLCVLVLGLSLRDVRAGLVAGATVPLALVMTFLVMRVTGETMNLMSLGGMAVAIGLVIDDAIIVIEAIARRREAGEDRHEAAAHGTGELAAAVIGTTATTIVVFVPLAFVPGLVGDFFAALAATLSASVVLSLFLALFGLPAVAARFFGHERPRTSESRLDRIYGSIADWGAGRRWVGVIILAAALALGWLAAGRVRTGFLPSMDEGAFVLDYFAPAGTSLGATDEIADRIGQVLEETPEVRTFARRTGAELGPITATQLDQGDIMVRLVPPSDRDASTEEVIADVRHRLSEHVPEVRVEFVQVLQDVLDDLSGNPRPIEVRIFGSRYDELESIADQVVARIERVPGVVDVDPGYLAPSPTLVFHVDRDAAAHMGQTPAEIERRLSAMIAGEDAGSIRREDRRIGIRVRYPDEVRFDPSAMPSLPMEVGGRTVSVSALARPVVESAPTELVHESLQPVVEVSADHEGRDLGSVARDVVASLDELELPPGYRIEIGGQYESQEQTFASMGLVAAFGVVLAFLVLVAQFRAVMPAVAAMLTTPFAVVGALVTLWATGVPLNASSLMGCVLLVGLEVKTGILLLEVAQARASLGYDYRESLGYAARRRIRPIMLTTTATMFGVLPLALGLGAGAEIHRPLAIAVLGGLLLSKFLNLAALPSLAMLLVRRPRR